MKFLKIVALVLTTLSICAGCGEFIVDSTKIDETTETTETQDSDTLSNNIRLKAKEESNKYYFDAEMYKEEFYNNNYDIESLDKAVENYNKSIEVLEAPDVYNTMFDDDLYFSYNNMGAMQLSKWNQDRNDMTYLDAAIENLKKSTGYLEAKKNPKAFKNLGYAYYEKWMNDYANTEYRDLALDNYNIAYEINPKDEIINNYLGLYYIDMWEQYGYEEKYYTLAEDFLERALEINNDYESAIDNLSYLYYEKENLES